MGGVTPADLLSWQLVIPSPRETPAHRLRKVRTACPRSIADSWNKPEFTAAADMVRARG